VDDIAGSAVSIDVSTSVYFKNVGFTKSITIGTLVSSSALVMFTWESANLWT
jgi:hypothetical protein